MISVPRSGPRIALTASATVRRASMSSPESVSSMTATTGSRIAIWRISQRFFSPPEKPSFRYRRVKEVDDRHARDRRRILKGHEQPEPRPLVRLHLGHVLASEEDLPLGYLEAGMPHDRVRERGLPGPVRSHQRMDLALRDVQV